MKWTGTFSYLPINHGAQLARISNHLQKVVFDNNLNGDAVRVRFSNRYSKEPLSMQRVTIGTVRNGKAGSAAQVKKDGRSSITLEPGEEVWSDETRLSVSAGDQIEVYIYIKDVQSIGSVCIITSTTGARVYNEWPEGEGQVFYGFSGVQVYTDDEVKTIAAFGDSITQMSEMTNALCQRLGAAYPGKVSLINRGISGNRLLHDARPIPTSPGCEYRFGQAGLARFEQDVFSEGPVDTVMVLIGINDIMHPVQFLHAEELPAPEQLIDGYCRLADIAHAHGAKILIGTILPCVLPAYPRSWAGIFERLRTAVNDWIRTQTVYDGWIDYDAAVRDEEHPDCMRAAYHDGDGLHPNAAGGAAMASAVDLRSLI